MAHVLWRLLRITLALTALAAVAVWLRWPKDRAVDAYFAAMRADLIQLARAQDSFHRLRGHYTSTLDSLGLTLSPGVSADITHATSGAWEAVVTHSMIPTRCVFRSTPAESPPDFAALRTSCSEAP